MPYNVPSKPRDFFDWEEYREANLICAGGLSIIIGGRNIGKTTGTFIKQLYDCSQDKMMFYVRNTLKEIQSYKKTFNAKYNKEFYMSDTEIWKLEQVELVNKKTKEVEVEYRKKEIIGFCASLNGTDGWRSADFSKIKYIFVEEFNQIGNSLDTEKFITLWTSILRTKEDVYTVIIGNRDDASSDLIVELGINVLVPEGYQGDWVIPLLPKSEKFNNKAFFIDLDDNRFNNNNADTIWKAIGRETEVMGEYYDRGYKSYDNIDCKKLPDEILNQVQWDFAYTHDIRLICGKLEDITIVHWDKEKRFKAKLELASIPQVAKSYGLTPIEHNQEYVFYYLTQAIKNEKIIYTSIPAKEDLHIFLDDLAYILDEDDSFIL